MELNRSSKPVKTVKSDSLVCFLIYIYIDHIDDLLLRIEKFWVRTPELLEWNSKGKANIRSDICIKKYLYISFSQHQFHCCDFQIELLNLQFI